MGTPEGLIYALCLLTSGLCCGLLVRGFMRSRQRLLLWSALYFCFLALNSLIVLMDFLAGPGRDLSLPRALASLAAVCVMLYGFIMELG